MALHFRPHFDKIVELLLYLAHSKPGVDAYQVVKLFYLADRAHLNRYGRPITYEKYFALPYGPVASKALDLIEGDSRTMSEAGIFALPFATERVDRRGPNSRPLRIIKNPIRAVDFDVFSKSDIKVFDEVLRNYGDLSFGELYSLTHEHLAYRRAWSRRGDKNASLMDYADMLEDQARRAQFIYDFGPISARL